MRYFLGIFIFVCIATVSFMGYRGMKSTQPPIYIFPDMDWQAKYKPQAANDFFTNHMDDRPFVQGTTPRGQGWDQEYIFSSQYTFAPAQNPILFTGKNPDGSFHQGFPIPVTHDVMDLGQRKYTLFCQVCHGALGDGQGITKEYGMIATPSYHDARLRDMPEGEIFNTITHGKNTMGYYADKLSPEERWAVVAYVRALQRAHNARLSDVAPQYRQELGL